MAADSVTFIISPYHVGLRNHRVGNGPGRILQWNLIDEIEDLGVETHIFEIEPVDNFEGEIGRSFEVLRRISRLVSQIRSQRSFPIILSGNCMVSVGVACGLGIEDLGFVYFDAHDDMDTPSTNENGYLDAMGLSMLAGQSFHTLWKTVPGHELYREHKFDKFIYCGLRDISEGQRSTVQQSGAQVIWGGEERTANYARDLEEALAEKDFRPALVHLDLDVLDKSLGKINGFESSGGLHTKDLLECITVTAQSAAPVSLVVCSFDPDLGGGHRIARIAVQAIRQFVKTLVHNGAIKAD